MARLPLGMEIKKPSQNLIKNNGWIIVHPLCVKPVTRLPGGLNRIFSQQPLATYQ